MAHVLRDLMAAATGATTSVAHAPFRAPLRGAAALAFANALPAALFRELRAECIARRAAERQSVMDPRSLQQTSWLAAEAPARSAVARAARHLEAALELDADAVAGVEWWQQRVPSDAPMRAHWDKDECEAADGLQLTHPSLATVLYLDDAGGPTLVLPWRAAPAGGRFELAAADDEVATAAFPKANTLLCFQGDLLHGVLPCASSGGERATLLMNWWRSKPRAPCCVVPRDEAGAVEAAAESGAARPPAPVAPSAADGEHLHELQLPEMVGGGAAELRLPWERERPPPPGTLVQWTL
jgi:hypothetical protein